jgi:hypothetical protein
MRRLVMRRGLLVWGLAALAQAAPSVASAETFTALASLSHPHVSVGSPVLATVEFGFPFAVITRVCCRFTFQGDLLDPGEYMVIIASSTDNGPGFENVFFTPQDARTVCVIQPDQAFIPAFLDGMEQMQLLMQNGSVTIAELHVDIDGTRGAVPVARRTWGVLKTLYR